MLTASHGEKHGSAVDLPGEESGCSNRTIDGQSVVTHHREGGEMKFEDEIDELIKAGWRVVESDFDPGAFQHWRLHAFECLNAMFGPDHVYTKYFEQFVKQEDKTHVLAAGGVLVAANEMVKEMEGAPANSRSEFGADLTHHWESLSLHANARLGTGRFDNCYKNPHQRGCTQTTNERWW